MRILIVDDEAGARNKVRRFLENHDDCEVIGECESGSQAVAMICTQSPDLVFLDINMPNLDGFQTLEALPEEQRPMVVFATAYDDRAVQAFEVNAVDYLLKPFDRRRFDETLERVRKRAQQQAVGITNALAALNQLNPQKRYSRQILVGDGGKMSVVSVAHLDYIESASNYVVLHVGSQQHILRQTLAATLEKLDPNQFCRVHRQFIVNIRKVVEIQPWAKGDMVLILVNKQQVKLSRRYKDRLFELMG